MSFTSGKSTFNSASSLKPSANMVAALRISSALPPPARPFFSSIESHFKLMSCFINSEASSTVTLEAPFKPVPIC